jgi:hypothetical protein
LLDGYEFVIGKEAINGYQNAFLASQAGHEVLLSIVAFF